MARHFRGLVLGWIDASGSERENVAIFFEKNTLAATCDEGTYRPTRECEKKKISKKFSTISRPIF